MGHGVVRVCERETERGMHASLRWTASKCRRRVENRVGGGGGGGCRGAGASV